MTKVFDKSELAKLYPVEDVDFTPLEKRMQDMTDEMQNKFNKQAGRQTVFFDLECSGLNKFPKPSMTMRSFDMNAVEIQSVKIDKVQIKKLKEVFAKVVVIDIGKNLRGFAKSFPLILPPGMQTVVIDSCSELRLTEQALKLMGAAGIHGHQAGKKLREAFVKLSNCSSIEIKGKNKFINDDGDVLYSRQQSQKWANSYSHKRPKKL